MNVPSKVATMDDIVKCGGDCAICMFSIDPEAKIYVLPCD